MSAIAAVLLPSVPDLASILLTTSATLGADKTYSPEGFQQPGVARWVDRAGGIAIGFPALTLSVRPPVKGNRVFKVMVKLVLPTLEQTSPSTASGIQPAPTKAYDCQCVMEFMLPERSTLAERQLLFGQVMALFHRTVNASDAVPSDSTGSPLENAVLNFEPVY